MLRVLHSARRAHRSGFVSALALAIAVAGGTAAAGFATPAQAQDLSPSRGFNKVAGPVDKIVKELETNADSKAIIDNIKAAEPAQLPALQAQYDAKFGHKDKIQKMVAAIDKQDDRYFAGKFSLDLGSALKDTELQKSGIKMMLDSGFVPQESQGIYNYYVGSLSFDAADYPTAQTYLRKAIDLGYAAEGSNVGSLYLQSFVRANQEQQGLAEVVALLDAPNGKAVLTQPPLTNALKAAYEGGYLFEMARILIALNDWYPSDEHAQYMAGLPQQISGPRVNDDAAKLVSTSKDPRVLNIAVNAVLVQGSFTEREALDAFRLLADANALRSQSDYKDMLAGIAPQSNPTEAEKVLSAGLQSNALSSSDEVVVEVQGQIAGARGEDREYIQDAKVLADARKGPTPNTARTVGNTAMSLGDYALAEEMLKLAMSRGDAESDLIKVRLGIAQLQQGKADEAQATFATVNGKFVPVGKLWLAYKGQ